ncbi:DNA-binding NtrC family response regulator [Bradyrhizobium sp. i1.4.4]
MASEILIVDDEADIRDLVAGILEDEGFVTRTARDSDTALAEIANRRPHLVFLDIWLQGSKLDGLQLLEQVKKDNADLPVVMISGHGNIETAVAAIKRGAYDFIEKPFKADRLILVANRALENSRLKREVKELKQLAPSASSLVGRSPSMNQLRQTIDRAAKANSRILIVGPAGAGKELTARTLHTASGRADGPFVVINAAAITPERMEHEMFGVEQSNGEQPRKPGALEEAHGGTLFIDEIADMPRETQNKILRVLVEQSFQRVGGTGQGAGRRPHHLLHGAKSRRGDRCRSFPRRPLSSALGGADPRAGALGAARGHSGIDRLFHGADLGRQRPAQAADRAGRDGGAAIACVARQRTPAPQQR